MAQYRQDLPPFIGGWDAGRERVGREALVQGGVLSQLFQMQERERALQQEQAFRGEIAKLGPTPEPGALAQVFAKFAGPNEGLRALTASQDRQAMAQATKEYRAGQTAASAQAASDRLENQRRHEDFQHMYRMSQAKNEADRLAETARHNKAMEELQRQNADFKKSATLDAETNKFANTLQENKVPALTSSIRSANELLSKYKDEDIPGLGYVTGSTKYPNIFRGEESKNVRSTLQAVSNDLLNLYSGLAVTLPEAERRELEEMRGGTFNSADFKNAWPRIVNRYNSVVGNLSAGVKPEVLERYKSRPGAIPLQPLTPAFGGKSSVGDAPAGVDPKIWAVMTPEEKALWQR